MKFKDKVVLITGASRGIGKSTALLFGQEGAKVVVNYVKEAGAAQKVVDEIKNIGSEALAIQADISDERQVKKMVEEVVKRFGRIDVLVNNAAIVFDVPFAERTVEQWRRTLEVNLIGSFLCAKYAAPHMTAGSSIINISSTNGIDAYGPDSVDYDASKAGVIILTKDLAQELAPQIRVNVVAPGWIKTDMNKDLPHNYVKDETQKISLKRWGKPEDIGKAVLFLASDDASYITGSVLVVDGGYQ